MNFYGQHLQDQFIYERYFLNKKNGISIECGAYDGVMESATLFFEKFLDWSTINIEVSPPIFEMLKTNRINSININKGLSNKNEVLNFKHVIHPNFGVNFGNGSFRHTELHYNNLIQDNCTFKNYEAETVTYVDLIDKIMEEKFPGKSVDLFVLDVEGFEIDVIEGMYSTKYLPTIFCIEFPHIGLEKLKNVVLDLGYDLDVINQNNAYFKKNDTNL
jgi:FkbM family methyltransferase